MPDNESQPRCRMLGPEVYRLVKEWVESMFHFDDLEDAALVTLFILQTRCYRALPTVFYIFVMGPPGSGKTCLLNAMAMLGRGLLLGNISVAAMARELGRGREGCPEANDRVGGSATAVLYHLGCFDEFDTQGDRDRHIVMEELLRHGYRRDGPRYIRWDLERNRSKAWDLYMPKAAAATSTLEPALASRGFRVSAAPFASPEGWDILIRNRYPQHVEEINSRLDEWADAVQNDFDESRIQELEKSQEHAERVAAITGGLGLNRRNEHALTCATIAYLAGVDLAEEIKHGIETLEVGGEEYEDEVEEVNQAILEIAEQQATVDAAATVTVKQSEVKKRINESRVARNQKPLGNRRFAEVYRAAGIKTSWIRGRGGKNYWVIPMGYLRTVKGLRNSSNSSNPSGKLDQHQSEVGRGERVDMPTEAVPRRIIEEYESGKTYDELATKYPATELDRLKIPRLGGREE